MTQAEAPPDAPGRSQNPPLQPTDYLLLLFLGGMWGSSFPVIRLGLLAGVPPLLFAGARCMLGAAGVAVLALVAKERLPTGRATLISAVIGGLLLIGGYFAFLYVGEEAVPGGVASILVATNPIWSAGFALFLLPTERLGRYGLGGLATGFLGVLVIFSPGLVGQGDVPTWALLEVLVSPLLWAFGTVALRRVAKGAQGYWGISTQLAAGALVLFVGSLSFEHGVAFPWAAPVWYALAYLVAVPTCIGYVVYFFLHHHVGPTQANLVSYISPVSALLVGAALLAEVPSWTSLVGLALVALGLFLVGRDRRMKLPGSRG